MCCISGRDSRKTKKALRTLFGRLSLVAGVVLPGLRPSEYHYGDALLPETLTRSARIGFFLTLGLHEQAHDARAIKNPVRLWRTGFLVVAGVGLEPTTFGL